MTHPEKDLFRALFGRASQHSFELYNQVCLARLPSLLLRAALQSAPEVTACSGLIQLRDALDRPKTQAQTWKNPELYPYLNYLAFPRNGKRQFCVDALRVHCGLIDLDGGANPDVRYWRLSCGLASDPVVKFVSSEGHPPIEVSGLGWALRTKDRGIAIYRPHGGLFDDVEPRLYGAQSTLRSNQELECLLLSALSIIERYSASLHANILGHISCISFLREVNGRPISFSLRNRYIGGIFVTIASPIEVAEQIIHEYYHQCLWPWWLVEPPEDLPDAELQITSPITGAARSLATMMQAVLIYASLLDFYAVSNEDEQHGVDRADRERAVTRERLIRNNFDSLASTVLDELSCRPQSQRFVRELLILRPTS